MSDSDDDNIVRYGTQLEPYEEDHTSTMGKIQKPWARSKRKRFSKLIAAKVNPKTAYELCDHQWPMICQLVPELKSIAPLTSKKKKKKPQINLKVRDEFQPIEHLSRKHEPDQALFWHSPCDDQQNSQDTGTSSHYWESTRRREGYHSSNELESNQESLDQPFRPPLRYTQEVLHASQHNYREETNSLQERCYETNQRKRHHNHERESHLEPSHSRRRLLSPHKVPPSFHRDCGQPNSWERDYAPLDARSRLRARSPPRARSPLRARSPMRARSPIRAPSPMRVRSPIRAPSPMRVRSPIRAPSPMRACSPLIDHSPFLAHSPMRVHSPLSVHSPLRVRSPPRVRLPPMVRLPPRARSPVRVHSPPRARSPLRARHEEILKYSSSHSYKRTQMNYIDDGMQVQVKNGLRAVNCYYNEANDDKPSDQRYKNKKTTSEAEASVNYWPDLDRPSRLGLRDETHPPKQARTYNYHDDKRFREDPRNYQKISWDSSVNLDYGDSDRPSRDGLRNETQPMLTICIDDDSEEEYRGPTDVIPVNEGGADHWGLKSETQSHSPWHQPAKPQESSEKDANVNKNDEPIRVGICNVVPMTKQQMTLVQQSINRAIVKIKVQDAGPKFLGSSFKIGWIRMICQNHESRKWLERVVPSLKPWPGAWLSIKTQEALPKTMTATILIPDKEGVPVPTALELLRVQNPGLNTSNWKVFKEMKTYTGTIVLLSIDEASFEALKLVNFEANLGMNKVTFRVKSWPGKKPLLPTPDLNQRLYFGKKPPAPAEVPLASSSAYTQPQLPQIDAKTGTAETDALTVTGKVRRRKPRGKRVKKQTETERAPEEDKKLISIKNLPNESFSSSDWVTW